MLTPARETLQFSAGVVPSHARAGRRRDNRRDGGATRQHSASGAPAPATARENHDERIDGTKVMRLWMREVVGQREKERWQIVSRATDHVARCGAGPRSQEGQGRVDESVGRIERLVFQNKRRRSSSSRSRYRRCGERSSTRTMRDGSDVVLRLLHLVVHVGNLTKALVFGKLSITMFWM